MVANDMINEEGDEGRAATARRMVLDQHAELRRLLAMGMAQANAAVKGASVLGHEHLRSLVAMVRDVFVQHLADEEALILPFLEDDLPVGPLRAERLREEHSEQRAELEALCSWPDEDADLELALRFEALGAALLHDIAHEEQHLLTPEIIRDDCIVIDQFGG